MKFFTLFLLMISLNLVQAQSYIQGTVSNPDTGEPVPFVNIGIIKVGVGTVSDENGQYRLRLPEPQAIVTFSAIGYQTLEIEGKTLLHNGAVDLRQRPYAIPEVIVDAAKFGDEVIIGLKLEEKVHSIGFGSSELGTEIAAHLRIDKETLVKSAQFPINHATGDSLLFRVNLYDFQDGKKGENLLRQNVIVTTDQKRGTLIVDLADYHLIVFNDVLLSLEWIKDDAGKGNVGMTFNARKSRKGNNLYTKHTSLAPFKKMSDLHTKAPKLQLGFYLLGRQAGG